MSNHFSGDNLKFPGDDRGLDLTDVYMFTSADADKTVLIIDSNPTSAPPPTPAPVTGPEFYPRARPRRRPPASYRSRRLDVPLGRR